VEKSAKPVNNVMRGQSMQELIEIVGEENFTDQLVDMVPIVTMRR